MASETEITPTKDGLAIIRHEHQNIGRVLTVLEDEIAALSAAADADSSAADGAPSFDHLFAVVHYIRVFPDVFHHTKEEHYLFQVLRNRHADTVGALDELERQHREGAMLIDALDRALQECKRDFPNGLDELRSAAATYVEMQRRHIGMEERDILPLAEEVLTADERAALATAFGENEDPLFGSTLESRMHALFERITRY